ncbi:recombinase family protein [Rathayibacter sp. SD072]|uniref:recombinase family protein n=1 Tax=Rathayibacter sp. SD072 TaxID=2781731 RepID=UPI001A964546|nr:recombinase family protein [Rathayibacter sp. SD072]MBO0983923.1 recombinase family protein [Rathayibacter sp. SD072]
MSVRAAIYLRISLDATGEGLGIERHREDCLAIAAQRGWQVSEVYIDNSKSAFKRNVKRPAYDRMTEDFAAARFDAIVCWDLDRLTRQPRQLEDWIEAAEDRGLLIVTANGEADLSTDSGRMFARMKAAVARQEIERTSARQTRASRQRSEMGKLPRGVRLTGYTTKGEVVEDEAAVVRSIFESFGAGDSLTGIRDRLQAEGIAPRRGSAWHSSSVRTILTNPAYAGLVVYRGERTGQRGAWTPLVTESAWEAVQRRLEDPRRKLNREGTARKHLGSGLFECGECGRPLQTNGPRYWCRLGGHLTRSMVPIDALVLDTIAARLREPDARALFASTDDDAARAADVEVTALRARLASIEDDYDSGVIDGRRFATATAKVSAQLQDAERRRSSLMADASLVGVMGSADPAAAFLSAPLAIQRAVVAALVMVRLLPVPQGRRGFDPASVLVLWRHTLFTDTEAGTPVVTVEAQAALRGRIAQHD